MNEALATPALSMPRYAGLPVRAWKIIGLLALVAGAVALPFMVSNYRVFQLTLVMAFDAPRMQSVGESFGTDTGFGDETFTPLGKEWTSASGGHWGRMCPIRQPAGAARRSRRIRNSI